MGPFSRDEIAALKVMLSRIVRADDERAIVEEKRKELTQTSLELDRRRTMALNTFTVLGFDVSDNDLWTHVRRAMGEEAWAEAFVLAGRQPAKKPEEVQEADKADAEGAVEATSDIQPKDGIPTVREIVLSQLAAATDKGAKAADIRKFIEQTYNQVVHEKTVGMTLYRLSKDGLARREGRIWFSATPTAETENPGVGAPGSEEGVQLGKEDA